MYSFEIRVFGVKINSEQQTHSFVGCNYKIIHSRRLEGAKERLKIPAGVKGHLRHPV